MRTTRGGSGDFEARLARAGTVERQPATEAPLRFLAAILMHQRERAADPMVMAAAARVARDTTPNRIVERFPLLDLASALDPIVGEIGIAVGRLADQAPEPLARAGRDLLGGPEGEGTSLVRAWLDDSTLIDPKRALWVRVAAAPVLEPAAARIDPPSKEEWSGRACPACGDVPQCSVIVEESGGFLQGAPRYLICGRCALWWAFPRAVCASCGEDDSRLVNSWSPEETTWVRVDVCDTCRGYIKTFDLRDKGGLHAVPLVDDVATLTLDVWAHEQGLQRAGLSVAGV